MENAFSTSAAQTVAGRGEGGDRSVAPLAMVSGRGVSS